MPCTRVIKRALPSRCCQVCSASGVAVDGVGVALCDYRTLVPMRTVAVAVGCRRSVGIDVVGPYPRSRSLVSILLFSDSPEQ